MSASSGTRRGHVESKESTNLPNLLEGPATSKWYPGSWAPPAVMLTIFSIAVLLATFFFIWRSHLSWNLFRFPVPPGWKMPFDQYYLAIPFVAAVCAWVIVFRCARRP